MDVKNVKAFGAIGNNHIDDTSAIQSAADAISDEGGILYFPPGVYCIDQPQTQAREPYSYGFKVKSRTWILGSGRASIIRSRSTPVVCLLQGVSEIRISNLSFELDLMDNRGNNYVTAIQARPDSESESPKGVSDITVEACHFEALHVPETSENETALTLQAIQASSVRGLWILNNSITQMQVKLDFGSSKDAEHGFDISGPSIIKNNYIIRPYNLGITAVHFGRVPVTRQIGVGDDPFNPPIPGPDLPYDPGPTGEFVDLIIADNIIEDPINTGGIWVGADGDQARVRAMKRVAIKGNIIRGRWTHIGAFGVKVHQAVTSEDIIIEDNIICGDGNGPQFGVDIDITKWRTTVKSLAIINNTVRDTNVTQVGQGIRVNGDEELYDLIVSENRLENTNGIWIRRGNIKQGTISTNFLSGGRFWVQSIGDQFNGRIGPLLVRDNVFKNSSSDGMTLQADDATSFIEADIAGNKCCENQVGIHEVGPEGNFDTRYVDNDVRGNAIRGMDVNPGAILRDNRE